MQIRIQYKNGKLIQLSANNSKKKKFRGGFRLHRFTYDLRRIKIWPIVTDWEITIGKTSPNPFVQLTLRLFKIIQLTFL